MDFGADGVVYAGDDPLVKMAFNVMAAGITRAAERYQRTCDANRKSAQKRWQTDANAYERIPSNASGCERIQRENEKETVTEKENENGDENGVVVVVDNNIKPPSLEEVTEYIQRQRLSIDPNHFHDYYCANGWQLRSGQPMKDWKAAARNWARKEKRSEGYAVGNGKQGHDLAGDAGDNSGVIADKSLYDKFVF